MHYMTFLKRLLELPMLPEPQKPVFSHLHWAVLLVSLVTLGSVLVLVSNKAEATRDEKSVLAMRAADLSPINKTSGTLTLPLNLPPLPLQTTQTSAPQPALQEAWQTVMVRRGDNLSILFNRLGLSGQQVQDIVDLGEVTKPLTRLNPGQQIKLRLDDNKQIQELVYEVQEKSLRIERMQGKLQAQSINQAVEKRVRYATGVIKSSLFEAAQQAGMKDTMTLQMAKIFGWDIDFAQDLREGDSFTVVYEEHYISGERLRDGAILSAEFTNQGKTYSALRFKDGDGSFSYFTPQGLSLRKAFLRTPVDFTRISSGFSVARYHPILHRMRAHMGVDYAAPNGTPIRAASNGKVAFKGVKGGYGNTLILQHAGQYSTLYGHMSGYARGIGQGGSVQQGQVIGYVGHSGLATGPHLHYEFRIAGAHHDPLKVALPKAEPIQPKYKAEFTKQARSLVAQMDLFKNGSRIAASKP
ncbi:MAG: peptidoglycan DD-metalloendopeptidase family protein [Gammaproteobacteria bacterium]